MSLDWFPALLWVLTYNHGPGRLALVALALAITDFLSLIDSSANNWDLDPDLHQLPQHHP